MKKILVLIFLFLPFSVNADSNKYIIIESKKISDNDVLWDKFSNSKTFTSKEECETELVTKELSKNNFRKATNIGGFIVVVEYSEKDGVHTTITCKEIR